MLTMLLPCEVCNGTTPRRRTHSALPMDPSRRHSTCRNTCLQAEGMLSHRSHIHLQDGTQPPHHQPLPCVSALQQLRAAATAKPCIHMMMRALGERVSTTHTHTTQLLLQGGKQGFATVFGLWPTNTQGNKKKCWLSRPWGLTQTTKTKQHTIPAADKF